MYTVRLYSYLPADWLYCTRISQLIGCGALFRDVPYGDMHPMEAGMKVIYSIDLHQNCESGSPELFVSDPDQLGKK